MHARHPAEKLKVLVAIACFGEKNLGYLQQVIHTYKSMDMDVEIVVVSEAEKSVDLGVRVIVGTPISNPWSLPFAHKKLFVENVDRYDLYIYSEDDIHVTEANLRAFLRVTPQLADDEIAGFVRYETSLDGTRYVTDAHGTFQWLPASVRRRGELVVAEHTNEHAALYVVTNTQLKKAIATGRFDVPPYEARYDMLVSAATDVYSHCGARKAVVISELENFLVHHMSNRYVGQMGITLELFSEQAQTLREIAAGMRPAATLCDVEPKVLYTRYGKTYDEKPTADLLRAVPPASRTVLSIGCGLGATERELHRRGAKVTVFPLDSVVGATVHAEGIEVVHGSLEECFRAVSGRSFDCVLMTNLIHLLPEPAMVLERCTSLVGPSGRLVMAGPNFSHLPSLIKRLAGVGDYGRLRTFADSGIHLYGPRTIQRFVKGAGFEVSGLAWVDRSWPGSLGRLARVSGRFGARTWILHLQRDRRRQVTESSQTRRPVQV